MINCDFGKSLCKNLIFEKKLSKNSRVLNSRPFNCESNTIARVSLDSQEMLIGKFVFNHNFYFILFVCSFSSWKNQLMINWKLTISAVFIKEPGSNKFLICIEAPSIIEIRNFMMKWWAVRWHYKHVDNLLDWFHIQSLFKTVY